MTVPEELCTVSTGSARTPESPKLLSDGPQRADHYRLGIVSGDDKTVNQHIVTGRDCPACRKILHSRPDRRKLCIFQMERDGVVCSVTADGWVLIIENRVLCGVQSQELSERGNAGHSTINERVINHIVVGRILIDASAERAEKFWFIGKFHTSVAIFPSRSKLYLRGLAYWR